MKPILSLAYLGDAVMEILVREYIISNFDFHPGKLVKFSKKFITCEAQSDAVEKILPVLTEEEMQVFKRGRNAKTHFVPSHGELIQYRRATGFEALCGYLYFAGRKDRLAELFDVAFNETMKEISDGEKENEK